MPIREPFPLAALLRGMEDSLGPGVRAGFHPEIQASLEVCHQSHLAVHRAVKKAGAHFTSLGDSPAGPDWCRRPCSRALPPPYHERLFRELAEDGIFTYPHLRGYVGDPRSV